MILALAVVPGLALAVVFAFAVVLGVFLLAGLGLQCPDLLAGVFSGELAGLDGLDDLPVGISELVVATLAVILGLGLGFAVVPGVFLLATLSLQSLQFFDGVFPGELTGLDGLADFSPGISELVAAAFIFTLGFTLTFGLSLVITLAPGRFP